jgi:hypothetical protein
MSLQVAELTLLIPSVDRNRLKKEKKEGKKKQISKFMKNPGVWE